MNVLFAPSLPPKVPYLVYRLFYSERMHCQLGDAVLSRMTSETGKIVAFTEGS